MDKVHEHELDLNRHATNSLRDMVRIVGPQDASQRGGIIPFQVEGLNSHDIAMMLDEGAAMVELQERLGHRNIASTRALVRKLKRTTR